MRAAPLVSFIVIAVALGMSGNAQALAIMPNATLPDGSPGFSLNLPAVQLPAVQLPAVQLLVGFNAVHPPSPNAPTLELGDGSRPLVTNPDTGNAFNIFWKMTSAGNTGFNYNLPVDNNGAFYPSRPCTSDPADTSSCYDFGATNGADTFDIALTITGGNAIDPSSWAPTPPGTVALPAVQFNFDFQSPLVVADPTLSFNVTRNGSPVAFSVPEPSTLFLMCAGLVGLLMRDRFHRWVNSNNG